MPPAPPLMLVPGTNVQVLPRLSVIDGIAAAEVRALINAISNSLADGVKLALVKLVAAAPLLTRTAVKAMAIIKSQES